MDAVRGTITYTAPETGKRHALNPEHAVLLVRQRGWHLPDVTLADAAVSPASLSISVSSFHNAQEQIDRGWVIAYLPKMESHLEARLWNDVRPRAGGAAHPERHHSRHRAHRDAAGRVRDG
jgi:malate synthase